MAAAAEGLGGLTAVKAAADALGPGRVENVVQALVENVAQGQPALAVQTAGDHGAVAQHAQLAAQAVAVLGVVGAVVVLVAGPVEVLVLLYVDAGAKRRLWSISSGRWAVFCPVSSPRMRSISGFRAWGMPLFHRRRVQLTPAAASFWQLRRQPVT